MNNLGDGYRKNARDLFLGNLDSDQMRRIPWKYQKACLACLGLCLSALSTYYATKRSGDKKRQCFALSLGASVLSLGLLRPLFISKPLI